MISLAKKIQHFVDLIVAKSLSQNELENCLASVSFKF